MLGLLSSQILKGNFGGYFMRPQIICISVYNIYQHIFLILCKIDEESFTNVSINSEGSRLQ